MADAECIIDRTEMGLLHLVVGLDGNSCRSSSPSLHRSYNFARQTAILSASCSIVLSHHRLRAGCSPSTVSRPALVP
jgi:hypothetical protein